MKNNFHSTSSCKYLLQVHLIFVCKYRKKLLTATLNNDVLQKLSDIGAHYDFEIKALNSHIDHVHFLISYKPSVSISQIVRVLKQESTIYVWTHYADVLNKHFWEKRMFWSDGYFVTSIGNASSETIQKYIAEQGNESPIHGNE